MKTNYNQGLKLILLSSIVCWGYKMVALASDHQDQKPNVIFILADDLGWGDLSSYGNEHFKTPYLDRLASEGRLFTRFYTNSTVCSPTRAAFLTGKYPARLGIHGHLSTHEINSRRGMADFLDPDITTLADIFKANDYATAHFGKWHLGHTPDAPLPDAYGFDEHRSNTSNDTSGFDLWKPSNRPVATKMVLDETLDFIKRHRSTPFYVSAWIVDPHTVLAPSKEQLAEFERFSANPYSRKHYNEEVPFYGSTQVYYAAMTAMDQQIGDFLKELEAMGLEDNTLIIFTSDNGPEVVDITTASHSAAGSTGPFRGFKRSLYEGGIRVPFIAKLPDVIEESTVDNETVFSGVDLIPTLVKLCGLNYPIGYVLSEIDGEDVSSGWLGKDFKRSKPKFWEWRYEIFGEYIDRSPSLAMMQGDWKLLMNPDQSRIELYNLIENPSELNNQATQNPSVLKPMKEELLSWFSTIPPGPYSESAGQNTYPWPTEE